MLSGHSSDAAMNVANVDRHRPRTGRWGCICGRHPIVVPASGPGPIRLRSQPWRGLCAKRRQVRPSSLTHA